MFYLKEISLNNFRCYCHDSFTLMPKINVIEGNNAVGKTSLIEAVYFLGLCKSFRTNDDRELILEGKEGFSIKGILVDDNNEFNIVASLSDYGKKIKVNDSFYRSLSEYLGFLRIICFSPEDLKLIKGEPKIKRRFLDVYIGQSDKIYLKKLLDYNKVLKERNEILKNWDSYPHSEQMLNVYTSQLAMLGAQIIKKRREFLKTLEPYVNEKLKVISSNNEQIQIDYLSSVKDEEFEKEIRKAIEIDKKAKTTTVGPHRDDMIFKLNGKEAGVYGSQGQQRSIALAVKLGFAEFAKEESNKIIIILDDVFGELDLVRQNKLLSAVSEETQVLITTITSENIDDDIVKRSNIIKLEKKVTENGR